MNENKSSLGQRIALERNHLDLTQSDMAAKLGVSREQYGKYERDINVPGGDIFISLAELGADVQYILSGGHAPAPVDTFGFVVSKTKVFTGRLNAAMNGFYIALIAEKSHMTHAQLESYIQGRDLPRIDLAYALAFNLNVSVSWLLGGD